MQQRLKQNSDLYYKCLMSVIYDRNRNDSGLYCKVLMRVIYDRNDSGLYCTVSMYYASNSIAEACVF